MKGSKAITFATRMFLMGPEPWSSLIECSVGSGGGDAGNTCGKAGRVVEVRGQRTLVRARQSVLYFLGSHEPVPDRC